MGSITTGIGLISGINTAQLIEGLLAIEARGKTNLQTRVATLQAQRTALMDINARLLNMKTASRAFRLDKIFQSTLASSSNEEILSATAAKNAQPGSFQFIVRQLVSTSQQLSRGFADRATTPLGLTSMSFEFGRGGLAVDRNLEELNGGNGVARGKIVITDRSGAQETIDLTDVATLNEVIERINSASTVNVTARISSDGLVITDNTGGTGTLTIANAAGFTTATDLGIAGSAAGDTLIGQNINTIGANTSLSSLNDGNGVLIRNNVPDFRITARDGTVIDVDLGRINLPITPSTLLSDLNNGKGITLGDDDNKDIKFVDRDGNEYEVNLTGITTVNGLITRVAAETGGRIQIGIHADGARLTVTDTQGGDGPLKVLGAGVNGTKTATELGILNEAGVEADSFNGQVIPNTISDPPAATLGDVINRINNASNNNGRIIASLAADGVSLQLTDTTGGAGNLIVRGTAANPLAAAALGIETDASGIAGNTIQGRRLVAALGSVLVNNLNGGSGLNGATELTITDRAGVQFSVSNLDSYASLSEIIDAINQAAAAAGAAIEVDYNNTGNGLQITDSSGGVSNLIVTGDAAAALGIETDPAGTASNTVRGTNLQHRYVSEATKLSDLNYGRGIGLGKFKITDSLGASATIDIGSDAVTLYDVIAEINSRGLAINARINDTGDGLVIESKLEDGQVAVRKLTITSVSGTTAKDLNILGEAASVEDGMIDGSYERTVTFNESDTLAAVVSKINSAGIPVSASIINSGSGATPFRLNFTSDIGGRMGELHIDTGDFDLGLTIISRGQDAKVLFGSGENAFLVTSNSNTVTDVVDGLTLNLKQVSDEPVTITVNRDDQAITEAVRQFVTAFNDVIGRINQYDFYDIDTKQKGPLLGNPITARVREAMYRIQQGKAQGVTTQYQYLRQVGITIGKNGELSFNQEKFREALENDRQAVENLFATFESTVSGPEEIAPGVTIQNSKPNVTARGFGDLFDNLMDQLTNSIDGTVTMADRNFQDRIDATNKRIQEFDVRLEAKRLRLEQQFVAMETALAKLQGQSNALSSLSLNFGMLMMR